MFSVLQIQDIICFHLAETEKRKEEKAAKAAAAGTSGRGRRSGRTRGRQNVTTTTTILTDASTSGVGTFCCFCSVYVPCDSYVYADVSVCNGDHHMKYVLCSNKGDESNRGCGKQSRRYHHRQ